jgi:hypothetical protein
MWPVEEVHHRLLLAEGGPHDEADLAAFALLFEFDGDQRHIRHSFTCCPHKEKCFALYGLQHQ